MTLTRWALLAGLLVPAPAQAQGADSLPLRVAERQIDAFNRRDLDAFMALYADDAVVREFPSGAVIATGKAAIRARYGGMFRSLPPGSPPVRVEPRVVDGAFVLDYERWDAPPGQRAQAVWMYEIRHGLIQQAWTVHM
jgi:hypothetical protein